jgi:hypothetical protein
MAKWEIRFQRSARSFRLFTLGHCCFRFRLAFSLQPLAFAIEPREAESLLRGRGWQNGKSGFNASRARFGLPPSAFIPFRRDKLMQLIPSNSMGLAVFYNSRD